MQPRLTIQARPAGLSTTTSSAVRPEGKERVTVRRKAGRSDGSTFLVEGLGLAGLKAGSVDEALEDDGAVANSLQRAGADGEEVADEVELGELDFAGEVELFGVRDADLVVVDVEVFGVVFVGGGLHGIRVYRPDLLR